MFFYLAEPTLNTLSITEPLYKKQYNLSCRATFSEKIDSQLIQYLVLKWTGPDGVDLNKENDVIISQQLNFHSEATRSLTFHPLRMNHGGSYKCEAKLLLPDTSNIFNTTCQHYITVLGKLFESI